MIRCLSEFNFSNPSESQLNIAIIAKLWFGYSVQMSVQTVSITDLKAVYKAARAARNRLCWLVSLVSLVSPDVLVNIVSTSFK